MDYDLKNYADYIARVSQVIAADIDTLLEAPEQVRRRMMPAIDNDEQEGV